MSAREIIDQLSRLTAAELQAVERRIAQLVSQAGSTAGQQANGRSLRPGRVDGRLVLTGSAIIRQADVNRILEEFPCEN